MLTHAWLIPLIPALSFFAILGFGKRLPRGGSEIGIAALAIVFVLSVAVGVGWIQRVNSAEKSGKVKTEAAAAPGAEARPSALRAKPRAKKRCTSPSRWSATSPGSSSTASRSTSAPWSTGSAR